MREQMQTPDSNIDYSNAYASHGTDRVLDRLVIADWAVTLAATLEEAHVPMAGTTAKGRPLVSNGHLGVDLVRVPKGGGFAPHTHPGDHLLIIVGGIGTIAVGSVIYETTPGQVYLIPGDIIHAVGAITDHAILAVGSPHRMPDDPERMTLTDYAAIAGQFGDLTCLICSQTGSIDALRSGGCTHLPLTDGTRPDLH